MMEPIETILLSSLYALQKEMSLIDTQIYSPIQSIIERNFSNTNTHQMKDTSYKISYRLTNASLNFKDRLSKIFVIETYIQEMH